MKFCIGDRVEVEGYDESLQGSYFSSMLIGISRGKGNCRIKYDSLHEDENSSKKLKEYVDPFFVCPKPPLIQDSFYNLHELEVEKAYKFHDLRVHHKWEDKKGRIKNFEKFNASSRASASSSKPCPKHR
ncbi:hypothetical protein M9H77_03940 [Catharanthus roseus]|uniref:Uncharacterized protein n=1 Tax=Catharanthus roseus TaxID=4058 RepID=A0ACC0CCW8_CATRO|nr:hypothetical protein M9H77_03940 [Catharanthus roseus]